MRFDFYGRSDTRDGTAGDRVFQGIDMTRDLPLLAEGMISLGENTRTRTGHVIQRKGTTQPIDFNPPRGLSAPVIGSAVFRNPNGEEVLLIAPKNQTYVLVLESGKDGYVVNYDGTATGNNGTGSVELVQGFEKVLLLRNPLQGGGQNLYWDGVSTQTVPGIADSKWLPFQVPSGGTIIPGVWTGEPFMDRIIYYFANNVSVAHRDEWRMSDIFFYNSYDNVYQIFRTNAGEADYITRIMSYYRGSVVVFKNQSIHMATIQLTFPVSITQRILNRSLGSVGNKMPIMVGGDVIFLSQPNGFYLLSETIQDQITSLPVPISEPIQRVIDDINWSITAAQGCSAALDNYAFFGVCLKSKPDQQCLNSVLVYDTQRKMWESAGDTWADPDFCFSALHVTNYNGVHRLFAIDYIRGIIYLMYEGVQDEMPSGLFGVPFKMESRGYVGDDPLGFKRFGRASVAIQTVDPSITVTAFTDGVNEEKVLTPVPITKDRFTYYSHGTPPFFPATGDPGAPYREDYSIAIDSEFAGIDYEGLRVGPISSVPATLPSTQSDLQQQSVERFLVRSQGQWCALRIQNAQGTCEVSAIGMESTRSYNTGRSAA